MIVSTYPNQRTETHRQGIGKTINSESLAESVFRDNPAHQGSARGYGWTAYCGRVCGWTGGEVYDATRGELVKKLEATREKIWEFNQLRPSQKKDISSSASTVAGNRVSS